MKESEFLQVAKQAAYEAGLIIQKYYGTRHDILQKGEVATDFATKADLEAEERILQIITSAFPDHNIITEEKGEIGKQSDYTWMIDPLDGTLSFVSRMPVFAVSIGLLKDQNPILGVVKKVATRELLWAEVGGGAFLNGQPIQVSQVRELQKAIIGFDFHYSDEMRIRDHQRLGLFINRVRYPYVLGAAVSSSALVTEGRLDAYVHISKPWDFVATSVLTQEAGGKATDMMGYSIDWTKEWTDVVISNGLIHNQILEVLNSKL